jgi:hypothetical protein
VDALVIARLAIHMAEIIGAVSAVTTLVEQGFKISKAIKTYINNYEKAEKEVKDIAIRIDSLSAVLQQLESALKNRSKSVSLKGTFERQILSSKEDCETVFQEIWRALEIVNGPQPESLRKDEQLALKKKDRMRWPLERGRMMLLQEDLNRVQIELSLKITVMVYCQTERYVVSPSIK